MKTRIIALSCLLVLVLNLAASAIVPVPAAPRAGQIVNLLPAVDGVAVIDAKRFFSTALPKLVSANPAMMEAITGGIEDLKAQTGVDVRRFEQIAVGFTSKRKGGKDYDIDGVAVARGPISSAALIGAAKVAVNGKYREERAGDKTIYIFSSGALASQAQKQVPAGTDPALVDKIASKAPSELAVATVDENTIAFGDIALVRQTVGTQKTSVSGELTALLSKNEMSVLNFAGKVPGGLGSLIPLENDELGRSIDSIRFLYGGADVSGDSATLTVTARTLQNQQATSLYETLEGLKMFGKALLGGSKSPDKQVFARLIENARISNTGNEVNFSLQVPQSDIDLLIAGLK